MKKERKNQMALKQIDKTWEGESEENEARIFEQIVLQSTAALKCLYRSSECPFSSWLETINTGKEKNLKLQQHMYIKHLPMQLSI